MTDTRPSTEVRAFIHGMWADVADAWGANADEVDERAAAITGVDARRRRPPSRAITCSSWRRDPEGRASPRPSGSGRPARS